MNPRANSITVMLARSLLALSASFALACSSRDEANTTAADSPISPAGLAVTARPGVNSVFHVSALTLRAASEGAELYAAVKNEGDHPACNASFAIELRDKNDEVVGTGISGLLVRRFYRFKDGSGTIAGCVAPGDVTMVAITSASLSLDVALSDVRSVVYQSNYWGNLDVTAIAGVSLTGVSSVRVDSGTAYAGRLVNGLDSELSSPTVAIFPVNAAGRPLAVAYGASSVVLPAGGTWAFQTNAVDDPGVGFDAYPMGGP